MRRTRFAQTKTFVVALAVALVPVACSKQAGDPSELVAQDLTNSGASFNANEILANGPMQDPNALAASDIQQFLESTPYGGASFLAGYISNGVQASTAIASAAQFYAINPIVLLVHAEMDDGLIAATEYPAPSFRVEYAFGCGCEASGVCDGTYAGFDIQVACLASTLRDNLNAIAANGTTAGGWGPNVATTTLDGVSVTPVDDSTAALYQYTPVVAVGQAGGNWLFWNIWQAYASALSYEGASTTATVSWIGDACIASGQCVYGGDQGTCATQFLGGLCTLGCTGSCPSSTSEAQTFCADFASADGGFVGYCLEVCNPADPQCRDGYTCQSVAQFGDTTTSRNVCFPKTQ